MLKSEIEKFLLYLNNKDPNDLVFDFPHWKWPFDEVSLLVWWILCWIEDKEDIRLRHKILATKFISTNFYLRKHGKLSLEIKRERKKQFFLSFLSKFLFFNSFFILF